MNPTALAYPRSRRRVRARSRTGAPTGQASAGTIVKTTVHDDAGGHARRVALRRAALLIGAVAAAVFAWLLAPGVVHAREPELATLLRGMAAIKGLMAVAAAGLVWWRLGRPVALRVAAGYIVCASILVASSVLIWKLAFIVAAAVLFHAAGFVGLILALREGRRTASFVDATDVRYGSQERPA